MQPAVGIMAPEAAAGGSPPVLRGVGSANSGATNVSSLAVPHPTGLAVGDVMYCAMVGHRNPALTHFTNAQGWTQLAQGDNTGMCAALFRRVADAADVTRGTSTFALAAGISTSRLVGGIIGWQASTVNATPEDAAATKATGSGATITAASITTVTANARVIYFALCGSDVGDDILTGPGLTLGFNDSASTGGAIRCEYKTQVAAGAAGTAGFTQEIASGTDDWVTFTVAVRPA